MEYSSILQYFTCVKDRVSSLHCAPTMRQPSVNHRTVFYQIDGLAKYFKFLVNFGGSKIEHYTFGAKLSGDAIELEYFGTVKTEYICESDF